MQPLNRVLSALRREIETGLGPGRASDPWQPDRLTLNLSLVITANPESPDALQVLVPDGRESTPIHQSAAAHHLVIELHPGGTPSSASQRSAGSPPDAIPHPRLLVSALTDLFGAPGFDSSARAAVFCEALTGLSNAEMTQVLDSITNLKDVPVPLEQARHRIRTVIQNGPLKSLEGGQAALDQVRALTNPNELLQFIRIHWKTQDDWLA